MAVQLRPADIDDVPQILTYIQELAAYERLEHLVVADDVSLRETLFGPRPYAEVVMADWCGTPAGFALFFHNYSTFLARPGMYLEDLFVRPAFRGHGVGKALLLYVGKLAAARGCGRYEWSVLDWNQPAIDFYLSLGATPMDEWRLMRVTGDALTALGQRFDAEVLADVQR